MTRGKQPWLQRSESVCSPWAHQMKAPAGTRNPQKEKWLELDTRGNPEQAPFFFFLPFSPRHDAIFFFNHGFGVFQVRLPRRNRSPRSHRGPSNRIFRRFSEATKGDSVCVRRSTWIIFRLVIPRFCHGHSFRRSSAKEPCPGKEREGMSTLDVR